MLVDDVVMCEVAIQEYEPVVAQVVLCDFPLFGRKKGNAALLQHSHHLLRLWLCPTMLGVNIDQSPTGCFPPGKEFVRSSIEGIKQPDFLYLAAQATSVQDRGNDLVTSAVP